MLKRMRKAGCWQVLYGLESGDDRMLKLLRKGNTVEKNKRAIRLAKEAGLEVRGDFIVGTPGETWESLEKTVQFAIDMKLDYAHFNKFNPLPGSELYRQLVGQGYKFDFSKSSTLDHSEVLYMNPGMDLVRNRKTFLTITIKPKWMQSKIPSRKYSCFYSVVN